MVKNRFLRSCLQIGGERGQPASATARARQAACFSPHERNHVIIHPPAVSIRQFGHKAAGAGQLSFWPRQRWLQRLWQPPLEAVTKRWWFHEETLSFDRKYVSYQFISYISLWNMLKTRVDQWVLNGLPGLQFFFKQPYRAWRSHRRQWTCT